MTRIGSQRHGKQTNKQTLILDNVLDILSHVVRTMYVTCNCMKFEVNIFTKHCIR